VGLRELERRDADLVLQGTPKVAITDAQLTRQVGHASAIEPAGADPLRRLVGQPRHRVHQGQARRQLGTAAKAGPEPGPLGGRRRIEESAVVVVCHSRGTDRATIHPGGDDPDKKDAVKPRVSGIEGAGIGIGVERWMRDWSLQEW
jgi:hypothetical protein